MKGMEQEMAENRRPLLSLTAQVFAIKMTFISRSAEQRVALEKKYTQGLQQDAFLHRVLERSRCLTCNLSHSAEHVQALRVQGSDTVIHVPDFKHTHGGDKQEIECYPPASS